MDAFLTVSFPALNGRADENFHDAPLRDDPRFGDLLARLNLASPRQRVSRIRSARAPSHVRQLVRALPRLRELPLQRAADEVLRP